MLAAWETKSTFPNKRRVKAVVSSSPSSAWEGGVASYCQALIANPFYQLAPFSGTSYFSSPTLARSTLATPYPQFGGVTMADKNVNASWSKSCALVYSS